MLSIARSRSATYPSLERLVDHLDETLEIHLLFSVVRPPVAVDVTSPVAELRARLVDERIAALVVVDHDRHPCGIVTRTDLLSSQGDTAREIMSEMVFALPMDASLERAAALMAYEGLTQVAVTDIESDQLLGFVSALDIARHVAARAGFGV